MGAQKYVALGYIAAVHGIRGWVRVHSWTRPIEAIFNYQPWRFGDDKQPVGLRDAHRQGKGLLALLETVEDRDRASALVGQQVFVKREQLPATAADEYYWADLVGLEVRTVDGETLGQVERLMETGANDVLVIRGEREHLVPFVLGQYVTRVDLAAGCMEVDWDPEF